MDIPKRIIVTIAIIILAFHWLALALLLIGGGQIRAGLWTLGRASGVAAASTKPTPTPTKTPAPPSRVVTPTPRQSVSVVVPTPVPTDTPVRLQPSPTPSHVADMPTPPPRIVDIARTYGIDTSGRYIVIDQGAQHMYVMDGPVLVRDMPVSTGDPERGLFTPPWVGRVGKYWGTFSAYGVSADNAWHLFKSPAGNILIHGLPYTVDENGRKVYQDMDKLGKTPASRGCIRLRPEDAEWFTEWGPQGVPIVILPYPARK